MENTPRLFWRRTLLNSFSWSSLDNTARSGCLLKGEWRGVNKIKSYSTLFALDISASAAAGKDSVGEPSASSKASQHAAWFGFLIF